MASKPSSVLIEGSRTDIVFDHLPDTIDQRDELGRALDLESARTGQRDFDFGLNASWPPLFRC